jgi:hypothetical protein
MMKKIFYIVLLSCLPFLLKSAPLNGTYTIGGTSPNYATFNAAVSDLLANGVSGPVTFNVRAGTYTEQITFNAITGASAANKILFQSETGVVSSVILQYNATSSSNNWVMKYNGASYIVFNKMTLQSLGTSYSDIVYLYNTSQYDTIRNCILTAPVATSSNTDQILINACPDQQSDSYYGFINNTFNNGSYGVYANGGWPSVYCWNHYIVNNIFNNQYACGIWQNRALSCTTNKNTFTTQSNNPAYWAINVTIPSYGVIAYNKIIKSPGGGIYYNWGVPHIYNNFIEIEGTAACDAIYFQVINSTGDAADITYNTILVLNTNPNSTCFRYPEMVYQQLLHNIKNNLFINRGGGLTINLGNYQSVAGGMVDYNDYYSSGTYLAIWDTIHCKTLSDLQTASGKNVHSVNINPSFVSNTDLHLTLDNVRYGVYTSAILDDIDGNTRNTVTPDIGAHELKGVFTPHIIASANPVCSGSSVTYTVSGYALPATFQWKVDGVNQGTNNSAFTYIPQNSDTVICVVNSSGTIGTSNKIGMTVNNSPVLVSLTPSGTAEICTGDSKAFTVNVGSGTTPFSYHWMNSSGQISGETNNSYTANASGTYSCVVSNICSTGVTSNPAMLIVSTAPVISYITPARIKCSRDSVLFRIVISNEQSAISYQWYKNGTEINDASSSTYIKSVLMPTDEGTYSCVVSNACGTKSDSTVLIMGTVPSFNDTIHNIKKYEGDSLKTSITPKGTEPLTYQWVRNDTVISGASNSNFIIQGLKLTDSGTYSCILSNVCGSVTSEVFILTVQKGVGITKVAGSVLQVQCYPNPSDGNFIIEINDNSGISYNAEIRNVLGELVYSNQIVNRKSKIENQIDVNFLSNGIYFLTLKSSDCSTTKKLVIKH